MNDAAKSSPYIILDACCLINLYASGRLGEIVASMPERFAVASYVKEKECLCIYDGPPSNVRKSKKQIDIEQLIQEGKIEIAFLVGDKESIIHINLAFELDDGEAYTGAIAANRRWIVGTDDKKAIATFGKSPYHLQVVSSIELVKKWAEKIKPSSDLLRDVLHEIRTRASYEPGNNHPLRSWWQKYY